MLRRALVFVLACSAASAASAASWPVIEPSSIRIEVGKTAVVTVRSQFSGIWVINTYPWIFISGNPAVIRVEGRKDDGYPADMRITGVTPGHTLAGIEGWSWYYSVDVTVVCGLEDPIAPADAEQRVLIGAPVALRALTPIANRTTFTWYLGHTGDTSRPIAASGQEIPFVTNDIGTHYAWVMATTPCSASTAEFRIDAHAPKRRAVR